MDASVELITACMARLKATAAVSALVGNRILDRVPQKKDGTPDVAFPYVSLGPSSSSPDDYDCMPGEEITLQFDVWSSGAGEAFGTVECRKICDAIKRALHDQDLQLTTNGLVTLQHLLTRITDDPNPAIHHGVVQFTATVETP